MPRAYAAQVGDLILARLQPRVAVVTTPNGDANAAMAAAAGGGGASGAAPPLRDADHKFELTAAEFAAWAAEACAAAGGAFGVVIAQLGGVPGGAPGVGATQAAVFTRTPGAPHPTGELAKEGAITPAPRVVWDG